MGSIAADANLTLTCTVQTVQTSFNQMWEHSHDCVQRSVTATSLTVFNLEILSAWMSGAVLHVPCAQHRQTRYTDKPICRLIMRL